MIDEGRDEILLGKFSERFDFSELKPGLMRSGEVGVLEGKISQQVVLAVRETCLRSISVEIDESSH